MTVFKADGTGRWALYSGTDDLPFDVPRSHMSRIHAHSDFDYLAFGGTAPNISTSISIPQTVASRSRTITVGSHGGGGNIPFVFGQVFTDGQWVPLVGSVPIVKSEPTGNFVTWTMGLNTTGIFIAEVRTYPTFTSSLPSSRSVRFWISDAIMV